MKLVMGGINRVWLDDLLNESKLACKTIRAAVAYSQAGHRLFEHCKDNDVRLIYYGLLDEEEATPVAVLEHFLSRGPSRVTCKLVHGCFHPKVIWWHGFGAYVGSANLTDKAWMRNVEAGVFFEESELSGPLGVQLEDLFAYLDDQDVSIPLTTELVAKLKKARLDLAGLYREKKKLQESFEHATRDLQKHQGLQFLQGKKGADRRRDTFLKEWRKTLELMRGLRGEFESLNLRPSWVPNDADGATHFDQFLHAYYYMQVIGDRDDDARSAEKVERFHDRNKNRVAEALHDAATWWAGLTKPPMGEDEFIVTHAPRIRAAFSPEGIEALTQDTLPDALRYVNAFRMHARQVKNSELGLAKDYKTNIEERVDLLAKWLWNQSTDTGHTIRDVLRFVLWGTLPSDMEHRLWMAIDSEEWSFPHFGRSCLGELIGWARPDLYPPRNNRTNKALRSLGHDVELFFSE
jgi:hypothetical protein